MIKLTYNLEIITPCFCAGADSAVAEIRAPSIRGQLRWWFRVLVGFKSLAPMPVREQEEMIFGSAAGDEGHAGKLIIRVETTGLKSELRDGQQLGHQNLSDPAYLTFPIQTREDRTGQKMGYSGKGSILGGNFILHLIWHGNNKLANDLRALTTVFGHLGSLGFRSRRALGALALHSPPMSLVNALDCFSVPKAIDVRQMPATNQSNAISALGKWLRQWRSHGRSVDLPQGTMTNQKPPFNLGFEWALRDHDEGYEIRGVARPPGARYGKVPKGTDDETFRAALGLPIVQNTGSGTVQWYPKWDHAKHARNPQSYKGEGRFASPVILRPFRDSTGWKALVIFVDAHVWPQGYPVFLNGFAKASSLDLYNAMKADPKLQSFP